MIINLDKLGISFLKIYAILIALNVMVWGALYLIN